MKRTIKIKTEHCRVAQLLAKNSRKTAEFRGSAENFTAWDMWWGKAESDMIQRIWLEQRIKKLSLRFFEVWSSNRMIEANVQVGSVFHWSKVTYNLNSRWIGKLHGKNVYHALKANSLVSCPHFNGNDIHWCWEWLFISSLEKRWLSEEKTFCLGGSTRF